MFLPLLDDFFKFIESVFAKVKSFIILRTVNDTIRLEIIPIHSFVETVLKLVKTKWVNDLNKVGLQIAKAENEIYVFVHKGEEIFRGTKKYQRSSRTTDEFKKTAKKANDTNLIVHSYNSLNNTSQLFNFFHHTSSFKQTDKFKNQ